MDNSGNTFKMNTVDEFTNALKKQNESYAFNVWIPSLGRNARFNQITTLQQKSIVKSIIDSSILDINFSDTLIDIITKNLIDGDVDPLQFTVIDKVVIALALRINSIGDIIESTLKDKGGNEIKFKINLSELYEEIQEKTSKVDTIFNNIEMQNVHIQLNLPTLYTEKVTNKYFNSVNDIISDDKEERVKNAVGNAFMGEIVKYVESITILGEDGSTIDWPSLSPAEKISVMGNLHLNILRAVIEYINKIKEIMDDIYLWKFKLDTVEYSQKLELDGNFFMIS